MKNIFDLKRRFFADPSDQQNLSNLFALLKRENKFSDFEKECSLEYRYFLALRDFSKSIGRKFPINLSLINLPKGIIEIEFDNIFLSETFNIIQWLTREEVLSRMNIDYNGEDRLYNYLKGDYIEGCLIEYFLDDIQKAHNDAITLAISSNEESYASAIKSCLLKFNNFDYGYGPDDSQGYHSGNAKGIIEATVGKEKTKVRTHTDLVHIINAHIHGSGWFQANNNIGEKGSIELYIKTKFFWLENYPSIYGDSFSNWDMKIDHELLKKSIDKIEREYYG